MDTKLSDTEKQIEKDTKSQLNDKEQQNKQNKGNPMFKRKVVSNKKQNESSSFTEEIQQSELNQNFKIMDLPDSKKEGGENNQPFHQLFETEQTIKSNNQENQDADDNNSNNTNKTNKIEESITLEQFEEENEANSPKDIENIEQDNQNIIENRRSQEYEEEEAENLEIVFYIKNPQAFEENILVKYQEVKEFTVLDLKEYVYKKEIEENKNIRFILYGRELKNDEVIKNLNIQDQIFMHAFISEQVNHAEEQQTDRDAQQQNQQNDFETRGFERMRDYGNSNFEIIKQKFRFHAKFALVENDNDIDINNLINKEEE